MRTLAVDVRKSWPSYLAVWFCNLAMTGIVCAYVLCTAEIDCINPHIVLFDGKFHLHSKSFFSFNHIKIWVYHYCVEHFELTFSNWLEFTLLLNKSKVLRWGQCCCSASLAPLYMQSWVQMKMSDHNVIDDAPAKCGEWPMNKMSPLTDGGLIVWCKF